MIQLIGEGRPGGHLRHDLGNLVFIPGSQRQPFRALIPREDGSCLRERPTGARPPRPPPKKPAQQVVAVESEMNVLVEQALARNAADRQIALANDCSASTKRTPAAPCSAATSRMIALIRESARNRNASKSRAETNCSRASFHRSTRRDIGHVGRQVPRNGRRSSPPPHTWRSLPAASLCSPVRCRPDRATSTSPISSADKSDRCCEANGGQSFRFTATVERITPAPARRATSQISTRFCRKFS